MPDDTTTTPRPPKQYVLQPQGLPTPPSPATWVSLCDPSSITRWYVPLTYVLGQVLQGRGRIGLTHGEDGLVHHFIPDVCDRIGRPELDDVAEIWIISDMGTHQ